MNHAAISRPAIANRRWQAGELIPGLGAVLFAGLGEVLLFSVQWRAVGTILLVAGAILAGLCWGRTRERQATTDTIPAKEARTTAALSRVGLRVGGIAGALLLGLGGLLAWFASPSAIFGLQGVLWLAGIALLAVSCARWRSQPGSAALQPWSRGERVLFASLVALAILIYLYDLGDVPWRFHYDEVLARGESLRFFAGPPISLFTTTWYGTSLPSLPFFFSGMLMHLLGTGLAGTRAFVALAGALTTLPVYGLGRLLSGRAAAAIAAFAWATSPVAIHYSRVSIVNMTTPLCWAICFYFLLRGLRSHLPSDFAWAGLCAGLSMYTYYGTRLLPYLLAAYGVYLALFHFLLVRRIAWQLALVPVGFLVGFGPLLAYFIKNPEQWAGRGVDQLNVSLAIPNAWQGWVHDWNVLAPLADLNFLSLSVIPTNDHVYWGSFFSPPQALLALLGAGILVWRWKDPAAFLVLAWGVGVIFAGGVLVSNYLAPAFAHWAPAFPALFLALALPLAALLQRVMLAGERRWLAGIGVVCGAMLLLAAGNLFYYLVLYPKSVPPAFEAAQGRFLATLTAMDRVRFVGNSWQPYYPDLGRMVAPQVEASDLLNPSRSLPVASDGAHNLVFVFNDDKSEYLPLIRSYYPGGSVGVLDTPGGPAGSTYTLPARQTQSTTRPPESAGLAATLSGSGIEHRVDPSVGSDVLEPDGGSMPGELPARVRDPDFVPLGAAGGRTSSIRWEGEVYSDGGQYSLELRTDARAELWLDGASVVKACTDLPANRLAPPRGGTTPVAAYVSLAPGWHTVRLDLNATSLDNGLEWIWTGPDGVREIVPPTKLRHSSAWPEPAGQLVCP